MSILYIFKRKRIKKASGALMFLIMVVLMLMAAGNLEANPAVSVEDILLEVASRNSQVSKNEGVSSGREPVSGGSFKFYHIFGDVGAGHAYFSINEPVGSTSMQAVIDFMAGQLDKDAIMSVVSMNGYEMREVAYADYSWGLPNDEVEVWLILPQYVIEVGLYETGYDKATNLQKEKEFALQLMDGMEKAGILSQAAPISVPAASTPTTPAGAPGAAVTGIALDEPVKVSDTMNIAGVYNGATVPTTFSVSSPHLVTYISTYHWNNARGVPGGTIALQGSDGKVYGPWQVSTRPGQGGVPNAYWEVEPNIVVPAGTYTVIDSDPATWSQNQQSGGKGMGEVRATPHFEVTGGSADDLKKDTPGSRKTSPAGGHMESPAGVGSVGNIPGPSNTTEAIVGVAVPGLIATALGALGGLGGGGGGFAPAPGGTPLSPSGARPLPGTSGTPGTAAGRAGLAGAVNHLGRRRPDDVNVPGTAAGTGYVAEPDASRDNLNDDIFIDTKEMLESMPVEGTSENSLIVDTADEAGIFVQPESGIIIETAAEEAGVIKPDSGIILETADEEAHIIKPSAEILIDDSDGGIQIDTSALEDMDPTGAEDILAGGEIGEETVPVSEVEATSISEESSYGQDGYNSEGFDKDGFNREGFDKEGFDKDGFNKEGLDKEGFNREGFSKDGFDREGFNKEGFDSDGFNKAGFDKDGFNQEGFNKDGLNRQGFDREGYNQAGYNAQGYDKEGYNQAGFNQEGFNRAGFDKDGFDQEGFNQEGLNRQGYDQEGFNREGFNKEGFDREGFTKEGFDREGFNKEGFNKQGLDKEGYNRDGFDKNGFDREGYGKNGFDRDGYNREGYDVNGYDRKGYNRSGYDAKGYDPQGYNKEGFNKEGWDRDGYDRNGFNKDGFDREGYDKAGYDQDGYDRDGYDRKGMAREGYDADGYDRDGFNENGVDKDGYDREGFDYEGYNRQGYDPWGYDKQGYGRDGYHWSGYNADGYGRNGRHWSENPYKGGSPFDVIVGDPGNPFAENRDVIASTAVEMDADGNIIGGTRIADNWKPTKPPLGEPYPKTLDKYGPKQWDDEIPRPEPEKPAVPSAEDTGVIGPEDPMNTLKNHELEKSAPAAPEGQDGTGLPVPEEGIPGTQQGGQDIPEQQVKTGDSDTFTHTDPETGETSTYEYEKGYTGPRHGDRQILVGKSDGQTYELEFNAVKGKWVNTESGNEFNPDDFDRWQNDLAEDRRRAAIDLGKMAKREDAISKAIDKNLDDWRKLEQMQKAADKYNIGDPGGPGDVDKAIEDLKKDMLAGKELDQEKMDKIRRVIDSRILGKTTADTGERWEEDWFKNLGWALEANAATAKEVVTGEKADGSISWLGMAARVMITAATGGGASITTLAGEITRQGAMDGALTVAEAMYRIKDSVDKGESDFRAVSKAIGLVILGEEIAWLAGKTSSKLMGEMLEKFPVSTNKAADLIEKGVLKVMKGDQLISKALRLVSKESAEETIDQINKRLVDIGGEAAEESMEKAIKGAGRAAAGSTDDIVKGAGKAVSGSGDDIVKGAGKATSGSDNIGAGTGKTAPRSDNMAKGTAGTADSVKTPDGPVAPQKTAGAGGDAPGGPGRPSSGGAGDNPKVPDDTGTPKAGAANDAVGEPGKATAPGDSDIKTGPVTSSVPKVNEYYSHPGRQAEADRYAHINMDTERLRGAMQKNHLAAGESGAVYAAPPKAGVPAYEFTNTSTVRISDQNLVDVRIRKGPMGQMQYVTSQGGPIDPNSMRDKILMTPAPEGTGAVLTYCDSEGNIRSYIPNRFLERWSEAVNSFVPMG
ncbi:MAG: hypothetical protein PHD36_03490 [Desulfotomaculaceae bacterium]|nr:hypothetical protein [Desulfotomaculaceae bacterium]